MNVNNFFKFIGDKFPEYRMTSDNEDLITMFNLQYEEMIKNNEIDDDDEMFSPYLGVPGESTVDANGKNGKFVQHSVQADVYVDRDGERDINYTYTSYETDFKNDVKHGNETIYDETYRDKKRLSSVIEYDNGKKIKRTRYRYFNLNKVYGPFIENVTYYNDKGEEVAVDFYRFITEKQGTGVLNSELNYRKFYKREPVINKMTGEPVNFILRQGSESIKNGAEDYSKSTIYFDSNGGEISKQEWEDLQNRNKEGYR
jgi:hypothetical protein